MRPAYTRPGSSLFSNLLWFISIFVFINAFDFKHNPRGGKYGQILLDYKIYLPDNAEQFDQSIPAGWKKSADTYNNRLQANAFGCRNVLESTVLNFSNQ